MKRVLVLGASGMLGSMVCDVFSRNGALKVTATVRDEQWLARGGGRIPSVDWKIVRVHGRALDSAVGAIDGHDWVVNCIGITKPLIHDDNPSEAERAIWINALFPYALAARAAETGAQLIQIATDCVYSGSKGAYTERDPHDALDVYGKSKSLGEVRRPNIYHLRCSIVGPEPKDFKFLLEWFRRQPRGATVKGYKNHFWNGLTTLHFARICEGIITDDLELQTVQHVLPSGHASKVEMLRDFAEAFDREDVVIEDFESDVTVDRTLDTADAERNQDLWRHAGYASPPTVREMIVELSRFDYRVELSGFDYRMDDSYRA